MSVDEQKQFFTIAYEFIANKMGETNILNATVHFDEDTPHMHVNYLPIVEVDNKKKLSSRAIWKGKNTYHELQESYYKYITKEKGYNLERGEVGSIAEHLTVSELKVATNYEENSKKERNINSKYWNKELKASNDIVSRKSNLVENDSLMKKGTYNKDKVDEVISNYQKEVKELSKQSDMKDEIIKDLTSDYKGISSDMVMKKAERLEKLNKELEKENKYLKTAYKILAKAFENIKQILLKIPVIKNMLNNEKLDLEQETICDYIKCDDIQELEYINNKYDNEAENEEELEMGD